MSTVTFKAGLSGYRCGNCDHTFLESDAERVTEVEPSEAWGAREVRESCLLACPECGDGDLDPIEICRECLVGEANDGGFCGACAPEIEDDMADDITGAAA
jgi:hypothetical protein